MKVSQLHVSTTLHVNMTSNQPDAIGKRVSTLRRTLCHYWKGDYATWID